MKTEEVLSILKLHQSEAENRYRVKILGIFGSFARRDASPESDIDILVAFNDKADLFDLVGLSLFFEEKFGRKVDIVERDTLHALLRNQILQEILYL